MDSALKSPSLSLEEGLAVRGEGDGRAGSILLLELLSPWKQWGLLCQQRKGSSLFSEGSEEPHYGPFCHLVQMGMGGGVPVIAVTGLSHHATPRTIVNWL